MIKAVMDIRIEVEIEGDPGDIDTDRINRDIERNTGILYPLDSVQHEVANELALNGCEVVWETSCTHTGVRVVNANVDDWPGLRFDREALIDMIDERLDSDDGFPLVTADEVFDRLPRNMDDVLLSRVHEMIGDAIGLAVEGA